MQDAIAGSAGNGATAPARRRTTQVLETLERGKGFLRPQVLWLGVLLAAICFEGLGRKFLPSIPSVVFYFFKDAVLVTGAVVFGLRREVVSAARRLFGGFIWVLAPAFLWTLLEIVNPEQGSIGLGLTGLRAYWLWWLAPLVIASALYQQRDHRYGVAMLGVIALVVTGFAAYQFVLPPGDDLNRYALYEGQTLIETTTVFSTGRARVSSTFSFITGFVAFVTLVPPVLLSLGLALGKGKLRILSLVGALASAATLPMSGSRGAVILAGGLLVLVFWGSGALRSRNGRLMAAAGALALGISLLGTPEAVEGIRDRFRGTDTGGRIGEALRVLPPIAIAETPFPVLGVGTGMQQNARFALGVRTPWNSEGEPGRYLVELGLPGYLLVWLVRLGLVIALIRAGWLLRRAGQGATSGAAYAYAAITMFGNLTFDHVWQAIYFVGVGLILHAAASVMPPETARIMAPRIRTRPQAPTPHA